MTRLLAILASMMSAIAAQAQEQVTTFTLDNGMDVVVIEDNRAPVVVQMLWYKVGSADEPAGKSGVAHVLEHLMFEATDVLEAGEFSATVAANGGSDNAFTSYDYTAYFQRVASDRLELMMQMESNRMNNLRISQADVETERQVVLEERNQRTENSPDALAREQMRAALFQNSRYGAPVIGWKHEVEQLDLQDTLGFYDLYYSPNNAVLVVAGDVQPDEVLALAEKYYGVIPAEDQLPPRERPQEPPQRGERRITFVDERVSQPYLVRSYLAPERDPGAQGEAAALVYLAELLGGSSFTSALGQALQFDTQTAIYTNASYSGSWLDDAIFSFAVVPSEGVSLTDAETAMDEVISAFMEAEIDPERMESIRTQLRASEIYALDNVQGLAQRYGAALSQSLTVVDVQAWPDILQAVTENDIKAVAAKVFNRDQAVTGWIVSSQEEAR